jgi:hypothetical protein
MLSARRSYPSAICRSRRGTSALVTHQRYIGRASRARSAVSCRASLRSVHGRHLSRKPLNECLSWHLRRCRQLPLAPLRTRYERERRFRRIKQRYRWPRASAAERYLGLKHSSSVLVATSDFLKADGRSVFGRLGFHNRLGGARRRRVLWLVPAAAAAASPLFWPSLGDRARHVRSDNSVCASAGLLTAALCCRRFDQYQAARSQPRRMIIRPWGQKIDRKPRLLPRLRGGARF